jgi:hypothetical protein
MTRAIKTLLLVIFWVQPFLTLQAQIPGSKYTKFEDLLESMTEEKEDGEELTSLIECLQELHENPMSINTADMEDLLKIPFLNEITAKSILEYRKKYGGFFSVYELASVSGIGRDLAEKISFLISTTENAAEAKQDTAFKRKGHHQLLARSWVTFPKAAGFSANGEKPAAYQGSRPTIFARYHYEKSGVFQAGFTVDKDPGEQFFKGSNPYGFDFYSGHLSFRINKLIPSVIVGDFTAGTGQGLVLWQGFSLGRSSDIMQASRNMSQIRPYTSTDENNFFRGLAAAFQFKKSKFNLFISSKKTDANLALADDSSTIFTSLQTSGYHRTLSEIEDKKSIRHTVVGAFFNLYSNQVKTGITAIYERFQYPFNPGDQLYEKFLFRGTVNCNLSADYHWITGKYHFFGEAAISKSMGIAITQGIEARLHDQLALTLQCRYFDKDYHATWASAFASDSKANGETGWYAGFRMLPASKIAFSAYADWHYWPWIKYTTIAPSEGSDYLLQTDFRINKRLTGYIRYRNKTREKKTAGNTLYFNTTEKTEILRFHATYDINNRLSFCGRLELCRFKNKGSENGILAFQDFIWTPKKLPLSTVFRISWFHTESFNSRIYAYENDLLYAFSTLSFWGEGFRFYLKFKYELLKNLDVWGKVANTWYPGKQRISSENNELNSNLKTEAKIQIRYRF